MSSQVSKNNKPSTAEIAQIRNEIIQSATENLRDFFSFAPGQLEDMVTPETILEFIWEKQIKLEEKTRLIKEMTEEVVSNWRSTFETYDD